MARPLSLTTLRSAIPPLLPSRPPRTLHPFPVLGLAGPSSSFHTTSPTRDRSPEVRRRKRLEHEEARRSRDPSLAHGTIDPVLGYAIPDSRTAREDGWKSPWEGCRLQRILLSASEIYETPAPNYAAGESPTGYLFGVGPAEQEVLFGALPTASLELRVAAKVGPDVPGETRARVIEEMAGEQAEKVEMLQRILDLRNSNKAGIEAVNRQRVIAEFGRKGDGKGVDTGSSEVQAALLTQKIRSLKDHVMSNPKDISNKRSLRMLVQERARHLKYSKRKSSPEKYATLLKDLGLEQRAVEGELKMPF